MITKANENDLKEIISNAVDAVQEATAYTFKPLQRQVENIIRKTLDRGGYYLILKEKGCLKGWILIDISKDYFKQQNIGFIYEVYVLPHYRGKGYSKELIKAATEELSIQGCNEIERNIRTVNFYKDMRFAHHQR
ncbi:GNAT family N-acetyltransferase [Priestia megaterium]|jgi:GNAT superfamily N-acetyltransferase|uniref:GNAT family N-acetyltransferase n=1 Tax=Priestia megaterium TaxID=1404 RepID=UPI0021BF6659|nr:GNAT family N-acetyltransferase [Priestia megaterium]MCT9852109.1 GNAT family N-acetyltransferase [Priestia megaterium]MDF1964308.1 GNAT family N-acetyltransferase [Priestia megaterium]